MTLFSAKTLAVVLWVLFLVFVFRDILNLYEPSTGDYAQEIIILFLALTVSAYVGGTTRIAARKNEGKDARHDEPRR